MNDQPDSSTSPPRRAPLTRTQTDLGARPEVRLPVSGDIAAHVSPLDELMMRGRMLAQQLGSANGKQAALNPAVVQKSLRRPTRPGQIPNMERAFSAEAASRVPRSPLGEEMPKRPIAFMNHGDRPMSSHPRFSVAPSEGADSDRLSVASNSTLMRSEGDLAKPRFHGQNPRHDSRHEFHNGQGGNSRQNSYHSVAPSIASTFDFGFDTKPKFERTDTGSESLDPSDMRISRDRLAPDVGTATRRARSATPERRSGTPVMHSTPTKTNAPAKYTQSPNWSGRPAPPPRQGSNESYRRSPVPPSRQLSGDSDFGHGGQRGPNAQFILPQDSVRSVSPDQMEGRSPSEQVSPRMPFLNHERRGSSPSSPSGGKSSDYLRVNSGSRTGLRPASSSGNLSITRNASMDSPSTPREYNTPPRADSLPTPVSMSEDAPSPFLDPPSSHAADSTTSTAVDRDGPAPSYIYSRFTLPRGRKLDKRESLIFKESLKSFLGSDQLPSSISGSTGASSSAAPPSTFTAESHAKPPSPEASPQPQRSKTSASQAPSSSTSTIPRSTPYSKEAEDISAILRQTKLPPSRPPGSPRRGPGGATLAPPGTSSGPTSPRPVSAGGIEDTRPAAQLSAEEHVTLGIDLHERGALQESAYHLRLAANAGHPTGMLMFALACRHGWGMKPNMRDGVEWLRKVTQLASNDLGSQDPTTAGSHMEMLEAKGRRAQLALSIYELGVSHMNGWGTEQDKSLALRCFEMAGKWGDADALSEAGYCYANGVGCKKDLKKSAWYYRQAEKKGANMVGQSWIWKDKYLDEDEKRARDAKKNKDKEKAGLGKDKTGGGEANGEHKKEEKHGGLFSRLKGS